MPHSNLTVLRVRSDPGQRPLPTRITSAFAVCIPCAQLSKAVTTVSSRLPLDKLHLHLKRVRRPAGSSIAWVLVALIDDERLVGHITASDAGPCLRPCDATRAATCTLCSSAAMLDLLSAEVRVVDVPTIPPSDAAEFRRESAEIWPMVKPPTHIATDALSDATLLYLSAGAQAVRRLAGVAGKADACILAVPVHSPADATLPLISFASAAAPRSDDAPERWHPFSSCVMLAIEQLAASDRAESLRIAPTSSGCLESTLISKTPSTETNEQSAAAFMSFAGVKRARPWVALDHTQNTVSDIATGVGPASAKDEAHEGLQVSAEVFVEAAAKVTPTFVCSASALPTPAGASTCKPLTSSTRYLATGMDAFLTREPDTFEAMALLHSRVSRVIYCSPNPLRGALGSAAKPLHEIPSLNHHYDVFLVSSSLDVSADSSYDRSGAIERMEPDCVSVTSATTSKPPL